MPYCGGDWAQRRWGDGGMGKIFNYLFNSPHLPTSLPPYFFSTLPTSPSPHLPNL